MRRWRRLKWHSCGGLWIKDESFDLAPSFLSPVAHLNYYKGGLEENRVSKVHTKEELMWERSRKFFIFNTWRTMTDTSSPQTQSNMTICWSSTYISRCAELKKKALKCHGASQSITPGEQWPLSTHKALCVRAVFKGRKTWFSLFFWPLLFYCKQ